MLGALPRTIPIDDAMKKSQHQTKSVQANAQKKSTTPPSRPTELQSKASPARMAPDVVSSIPTVPVTQDRRAPLGLEKDINEPGGVWLRAPCTAHTAVRG
jgi:hypothetical protein